MNKNIKRHLISASRVFVSAFAGTLLVALNSGINWDKSALVALATAGISAGLKSVLQYIVKPDTTA